MPATRTRTKRPDLKARFAAQIDSHVNGLMGMRRIPNLPPGVDRVDGDVTDRVIRAYMRDGTVFVWTGGQYASRKVNGCYAPLQPKPRTLDPDRPRRPHYECGHVETKCNDCDPVRR